MRMLLGMFANFVDGSSEFLIETSRNGPLTSTFVPVADSPGKLKMQTSLEVHGRSSHGVAWNCRTAKAKCFAIRTRSCGNRPPHGRVARYVGAKRSFRATIGGDIEALSV